MSAALAWDPPRRTAPVRATLAALTAVEARRLLRHPVVLAGALLSVVVGWGLDADFVPGGDYLALTGASAFPLAVATMIAANLAALRSRRSGTGELHASLAAPPYVRTLAQLLAVAAPAGLAAAMTAAGFVWFGAADGLVVTGMGPLRTPSGAELAQGPVAVATAGAIGVALGRWLPVLPVASVATVALAMLELPLTLWNLQVGWGWFALVVNPARNAEGRSWPCSVDQTWPCDVSHFAVASMEWHLLYLAAIAVAAGAAAAGRDGAGRPAVLAGVAGLAAAIVAGTLQLP